MLLAIAHSYRLLSKISDISIMQKLYIDIHFPVEYGYISDPFNLRQLLPCLMQPDNVLLKLQSDRYFFTYISTRTGTRTYP